MLEFITFYQNALRQSALRHFFLPECIAPGTTQGCRAYVPTSFFAWIPVRKVRGYMFCSDFSDLRCEGDRA